MWLGPGEDSTKVEWVLALVPVSDAICALRCSGGSDKGLLLVDMAVRKDASVPVSHGFIAQAVRREGCRVRSNACIAGGSSFRWWTMHKERFLMHG
jgi:hypothetical protein